MNDDETPKINKNGDFFKRVNIDSDDLLKEIQKMNEQEDKYLRGRTTHLDHPTTSDFHKTTDTQKIRILESRVAHLEAMVEELSKVLEFFKHFLPQEEE